jgi:hypothetical protein
MVPECLWCRKRLQGKRDDVPAHTREAQPCCVFTQTEWDKEGFAIRDLDSTTYIGAIETAEQFGKRLHVEDLKARLEPRREGGGHRRRRRMDLEPRPGTLSRCR